MTIAGKLLFGKNRCNKFSEMVVYGQKRMNEGSLFLVGFHVVGVSSGSWWPSVGLRQDKKIIIVYTAHWRTRARAIIFWEIEVEHGKI